MPPSMPSLSANDILGTFVLLEKLGEGGMGAVWKARNTLTQRVCALKILRDDAPTADTLARFEREVRLASTVEHPNVVRVFDPFLADGRLVLPMEYVDGVSLQQRLRPEKETAVRLPVQAALEVMIPLCAGVAAIHARGIVHRDLKPANVMLARGAGGEVIPKVMDFGIAKAIEADDDSTEITREGYSAGSARYMAPEQALEPKTIDARADIYALGVITYQLLTGVRPIEAASHELAMAALMSGAPIVSPRSQVPAIPVAVDAVIMKALARDRADRFLNVAALATALKAAGASVTDRTAVLRVFPDATSPPPPDGDTFGAVAVGASPSGYTRRAWTLLAASVVFTSFLVAWAIRRTSTSPPAVTHAATIVAPAPARLPPSAPPVVTAPVVQSIVATPTPPAPVTRVAAPAVAQPLRLHRSDRSRHRSRPPSTSRHAAPFVSRPPADF